MRRITMTACVAIAAAFAYADPATGWKMTGAGPYRYADPENWVGGEVNGVFGSDLALRCRKWLFSVLGAHRKRRTVPEWIPE